MNVKPHMRKGRFVRGHRRSNAATPQGPSGGSGVRDASLPVVQAPPLSQLEQKLASEALPSLSSQRYAMNRKIEMASSIGAGASGIGGLGALIAGGTISAVFAPIAVGFAAISLILAPIALSTQRIARRVVDRKARKRREKLFQSLNEQADSHRASVSDDAVRGHESHWTSQERQERVGRSTYHTQNKDAIVELDDNGIGFLEFTPDNSVATIKTFFYPGADFTGLIPAFPFSAAGADLRGANFKGCAMVDPVFDGADLRGADISDTRLGSASFQNANLAGANLQGAMLGRAKLTGANLEGADVTGCLMPIDLSGADITSEQFDTLADNNRYHVPAMSVEEAKVVTGSVGDDDEFMILLWSGELEVRSREDNSVVEGSFDPTLHYIPKWAAKNFANKS